MGLQLLLVMNFIICVKIFFLYYWGGLGALVEDIYNGHCKSVAAFQCCGLINYQHINLLISQVVNDTLNPVWNQTFDFVVEDGLHDMLMVEVWDHDTFGKVINLAPC